MNPPREADADLDLKIPRASYSPRRSRVARRREKKFNQSRVGRKSDQIYPAFSRTRADLPKPLQLIVVLVPSVSSLREYCIAGAANPLYALDTSSCHKDVRLCSEKAYAVPHRCAFRGKSFGWRGWSGMSAE